MLNRESLELDLCAERCWGYKMETGYIVLFVGTLAIMFIIWADYRWKGLPRR